MKIKTSGRIYSIQTASNSYFWKEKKKLMYVTPLFYSTPDERILEFRKTGANLTFIFCSKSVFDDKCSSSLCYHSEYLERTIFSHFTWQMRNKSGNKRRKKLNPLLFFTFTEDEYESFQNLNFNFYRTPEEDSFFQFETNLFLDASILENDDLQNHILTKTFDTKNEIYKPPEFIKFSMIDNDSFFEFNENNSHQQMLETTLNNFTNDLLILFEEDSFLKNSNEIENVSESDSLFHFEKNVLDK